MNHLCLDSLTARIPFHVLLFHNPQELEVRSLNHPYSLKTKSPQCHYVVMTRSETKFQAPLNRRYQEVLAKTEHLTIKTISTGQCEAWITFSDISLSQNNERLKIRKK